MDATITIVGKPQMLVGINYPWGYNKYGWYFGPKHDERWIANNFYGWDIDGSGHYEREAFPGGPRFPSALSLSLEDLRTRFGVRLIRLFLLCNGQNLGHDNPWKILNPLPPEFGEHLSVILKTLRRLGMKAILSILDFGIGSPMERKEGRHKIVIDPATRSDFVDRVVIPFARIGASYHDAIYAWEAMNEPGWLNRNLWPHPKAVCTAAATVDQINEYLRAVIAGIRSVDSRVPTTVGHRFAQDLMYYETGDIPQYHYYPKYFPDPLGQPRTLSGTDPTRLPNVTALRRKPILGELGASRNQGHPWLDLHGRDREGSRERVFERLACAQDRGYEVALVWPDGDWDGTTQDDPIHFSPEAQQGLLDFMRRRTTP